MSVSDDIASVRSVLAGDKPAFAALVDRHRSAAVSFARRIVGDAEAEDVVQEAFLGAFLGLARLRDPAKFGAWLLGIVANLSKSRLRARREGYQPDLIGGRFVPGRAVEDCDPSAETVARPASYMGCSLTR